MLHYSVYLTSHKKKTCIYVEYLCFSVVGELVYVQGRFREYTSIKAFHVKPRSENCRTCTEL